MVSKQFSVEKTMMKKEDIERLLGLRLIDDDFFTKVFDGQNDAIELILRIILEKEDLRVTEVSTQVFVSNLSKHSVRFDILATDSKGKKYNVEIQRSDKGAVSKRARYHSSMLDYNLLDKGIDYTNLPETFVIFITEHDYFRSGHPVYHVDRWISETEELFGDEEHIIYVNGAFRGESAIGRLMHDFSCASADEMYYPLLADRVRYYKETEEGREIMCKIVEDIVNGIVNGIVNEKTLEKTLEHVKKMMNSFGISLEQAMNALDLSQEERNYIIQKMEQAV